MNLNTSKYCNTAWQLVDVSFSGNIRINEHCIDLPLKTKKPAVFVALNDLFHESVPKEFICKALAVMANCRQHTFLLLTKRPERLRFFFKGVGLLNVWCGTSIENQQTADERIPHLLQIPSKKFLSIEPMLGPIDISGWLTACDLKTPLIDQVILGSETGRNARPCHPDWVRSVRDQCQAADVPFFFKGWGAWIEVNEGVKAGDICMSPDGFIDRADKNYTCFANESEGRHLRRVKRTGRVLDGRTHDELAWKGITLR